MLDKILQKYLWYASSKEVKFTCENKRVECTKNALTLCIHICTDTLIGIESLVSETYLAEKKNYNLGIKKYKKVYNFRVYWGRDFEQYTLIALAPPPLSMSFVERTCLKMSAKTGCAVLKVWPMHQF